VPKEPESISSLWTKKRGALLHAGLTYGFTWRELQTTHSFEFEGDTIVIVARLDAYSPETKTIHDFKTTDNLQWQIRSGFIPRKHDVLQVQAYWTMFRRNLDIDDLKLTYIDKITSTTYSVPKEDVLEWVVARAMALHQALKTKCRPASDSGCWLCTRAPQAGKD
jgi:hypothetical protein